MSLVEADDVAEPRSFCSMSRTRRPRPAASRAIPTPLMPPPTTARSKSAIRGYRFVGIDYHAAPPGTRRAWRRGAPELDGVSLYKIKYIGITFRRKVAGRLVLVGECHNAAVARLLRRPHVAAVA